MAIMVYSHYMLGDGLNKTTPALIFGMLLVCRFIVYLQILLREREPNEEKISKENKNAQIHNNQRVKSE